jgi:hypothetical protein
MHRMTGSPLVPAGWRGYRTLRFSLFPYALTNDDADVYGRPTHVTVQVGRWTGGLAPVAVHAVAAGAHRVSLSVTLTHRAPALAGLVVYRRSGTTAPGTYRHPPARRAVFRCALADCPIANGVLRHTDTGLVSGRTYRFRVYGYDGLGHFRGVPSAESVVAP